MYMSNNELYQIMTISPSTSAATKGSLSYPEKCPSGTRLMAA
jgi:hypothetical protein